MPRFPFVSSRPSSDSAFTLQAQANNTAHNLIHNWNPAHRPTRVEASITNALGLQNCGLRSISVCSGNIRSISWATSFFPTEGQKHVLTWRPKPGAVQCPYVLHQLYLSCFTRFPLPKKENIKKELANCKELHEKSSIPDLEVTDNH